MSLCATPSRNHPAGRTGTTAGYQVHRSAGELPCEPCHAAHIEKCRERWATMTPEQRDRRRIENRDECKRRRENQPAALRAQKHTYIAGNRAIIRDAKDRPCSDCGVHYPYYVMQFDHVRGVKRFNIGNIGPTSKRSTLIEEIAKCDVVCANRHAVRTYERVKELQSA